jgi:8-oxo-dGTP pyrophosphatase MutT (NUDIX family)
MSNRLISDLRERLKQPLPGELAHQMMRAEPKGKVLPDFKFNEAPRPGAVLILLYPESNELHFPLIKRSTYRGVHSGQIALPGGKSEPSDKDMVTTALREAEEEIGVDRNKIQIIGSLTDFYVIPSNFLVKPVIAYYDEKPNFKPNPFEVEKVIPANLKIIIQEESIRRKVLLAGGIYAMDAPYFEVSGETVWGATAMMLNELRLILKDIGL